MRDPSSHLSYVHDSVKAYGVTSAGAQAWSLLLAGGGAAYGPPAISAAGRLYVPSGSKLFAIGQ